MLQLASGCHHNPRRSCMEKRDRSDRAKEIRSKFAKVPTSADQKEWVEAWNWLQSTYPCPEVHLHHSNMTSPRLAGRQQEELVVK